MGQPERAGQTMCESSPPVERWLPVPGWEGFYEVSDLGRVRRSPRTVHRRDGRTRRVPGGILRVTGDPHNYGRVYVSLCRNGEQYKTSVAHMVLLAFVGSCPEGMEGCHSDGNAGNDQLVNLRWDTHIANVQDAIRHGTHGRRRRVAS